MELGIQPSMLRSWRGKENGTVPRVAGASGSPPAMAASAEQLEIRRLRRDLERAQMERDILKRMARPIRKQFLRYDFCQSASTYPACGLGPGQDGDPRVPVLIKVTASERHF
jgi:hypothetical protein